METIVLSNRGHTVFRRFIDINMDKVIKKAQSAHHNSDYDESITFQRFIFQLQYRLGYHEDGCEEGEEPILFGHGCDKCNYTKVQIRSNIQYQHPDKNRPTIEDIYIDADKVGIAEQVQLLLFKKQGKGWTLCMCKRLAEKDGMCEECYIHSYERTEEEGGNCCICYENNGRWTKLECGHIFHRHCAYNIKKENGFVVKCPLCRKPSDLRYNNPDIQHDCYDV
jgi:hypothetical protein